MSPAFYDSLNGILALERRHVFRGEWINRCGPEKGDVFAAVSFAAFEALAFNIKWSPRYKGMLVTVLRRAH
jgi:hypothetical protein